MLELPLPLAFAAAARPRGLALALSLGSRGLAKSLKVLTCIRFIPDASRGPISQQAATTRVEGVPVIEAVPHPFEHYPVVT